MHYYIDGYNLLFHLCHGYAKNIAEERRAIIEEISAYVDELSLHATIVFDGTTQAGDLNRSHLSNLEILYTEKGETADEWILDFVKHHRKPNQVVVITSDKRLAWRARNFFAQTEDVAVFLKNLKKRSRKLRNPKPSNHAFELLVKKTPEAEKVPATPSIIDFYLETFTTRYAQEIAVEKTKSKQQSIEKKPKTLPPKKKPPSTNRPYSEEEYRQIFEDRMRGVNKQGFPLENKNWLSDE